VSMFTEHVAPAFGLGFALGAAPGPIQLLILGETAKRGFSGGLRVMAGANGTLFAVMVALALGFSSFTPGDTALRVLRIGGGLFLVWLGVQETRALASEASAGVSASPTGRGLGPTARGVIGVVLNPGAWVFFATTAASVVASASADGGVATALLAATAMTVGVSVSDTSFTLLGSGGRRVFGDRGLRWIRIALAVVLAAIGVAFVVGGIAAGG
jgi:threonine/homoserine/homoserine lactone efflux protein